MFMTTRIKAIARYTVLEAVRTRLPLAGIIAVLLVLGMSFFLRELALVQDVRVQTTVYAAIVRLVCIFIVALHVGSSLAREFSDKGPDTVLALDVPRWQYITGKYVGYAAIGIVAAAVSASPLIMLAGYAPAFAWFASLALETCIIAAVAMFCVVTFSHLPAAMAFVGGFYVLSRAISGLRLIADHPIAGEGGWPYHAMSWTMALLATLLPTLDAWTRTAWLVNAPPSWTELAFVGGETAVYVVLVFAATLVDFQRRSL